MDIKGNEKACDLRKRIEEEEEKKLCKINGYNFYSFYLCFYLCNVVI